MNTHIHSNHNANTTNNDNTGIRRTTNNTTTKHNSSATNITTNNTVNNRNIHNANAATNNNDTKHEQQHRWHKQTQRNNLNSRACMVCVQVVVDVACVGDVANCIYNDDINAASMTASNTTDNVHNKTVLTMATA